MAGSGELYQRKDGKWAFRVKAGNGQTVATDGSQGYSSKSSAKFRKNTLSKTTFDISTPAWLRILGRQS